MKPLSLALLLTLLNGPSPTFHNRLPASTDILARDIYPSHIDQAELEITKAQKRERMCEKEKQDQLEKELKKKTTKLEKLIKEVNALNRQEAEENNFPYKSYDKGREYRNYGYQAYSPSFIPYQQQPTPIIFFPNDINTKHDDLMSAIMLKALSPDKTSGKLADSIVSNYYFKNFRPYSNYNDYMSKFTQGESSYYRGPSSSHPSYFDFSNPGAAFEDKNPSFTKYLNQSSLSVPTYPREQSDDGFFEFSGL